MVPRPLSVLAACVLIAACLDWDALENAGAGDGGTGAAMTSLASPIVLWTFDGANKDRIADEAIRDPDVPLTPAANHDPTNTAIGGGRLFLSGGMYRAGLPASVALGEALKQARSFSVEIWVHGMQSIMGPDGNVLVATGPRFSRSLRIIQRGPDVRASVRSSNVAESGLAFVNGGDPDVRARVALDRPVQMVMTFDHARGLLTLYVDGKWVAGRNHALAGLPPPTLVWPDDVELTIGGEPIPGRNPWTGAYYLVAFYDRLLDQGAVTALYRAGSEGR
jgi:hypothetical protein